MSSNNIDYDEKTSDRSFYQNDGRNILQMFRNHYQRIAEYDDALKEGDLIYIDYNDITLVTQYNCKDIFNCGFTVKCFSGGIITFTAIDVQNLYKLINSSKDI